MNLSTLIGFIASISVFVLAVFTSSQNFSIFMDRQAILIVVGGTMAASSVCFSLPLIFGLLGVFVKRILGKKKKDYGALISEVVSLSAAHRKGKQALEPAIQRIQDPFLNDASEVFFWLESEMALEDLRSLLDTRAETDY